jgi:hypothetical protein
MDLKVIDLESMDWIDMARDREKWYFFEGGNERCE